MSQEPAKLDETLDAKPYEPPRKARALTVFYVVLGVVVALGLFGFWFWRTWTVWWFDADEAKRRQTEAAAKLGVPVEKTVDLGGGVKLELVLIPAGRFKMGSPATEKDRGINEPYYWAIITRPFYIGKYEVTQEQWEKMIGANPSNNKGPKNPVEMVSWDDSQEFMKKLAGLGKETGRFRLPTEAEWEWACRAGTRTRFCSGDADETLLDYAWIGDNTDCTHPVGTRKPNAWGLYDMHGNVWEWCGDWYGDSFCKGYDAKSLRYDPTGPMTGTGRVLRGGSVNDVFADQCRSSSRGQDIPSGGWQSHGLRVVMLPAER